jgi:hypothetical protein
VWYGGIHHPYHRNITGTSGISKEEINMEDLYLDNCVESGTDGNAEIFAKIGKLDKKVRRLEKKKRKGGKKGQKKELKKLKKQLRQLETQQKPTDSWWENTLKYATPKLVDLVIDKIAKTD